MLKSACCAVIAFFSANAAIAQDTVIWQDDIQGWSVAIDRTIDDSCFIISRFDNDLFLRFQFNATQQNVQFIVASIQWDSLETGQNYDMDIAFGDLESWSGTAKGHRWKDILPSLVLSVPFADQQASHFMSEFTAMESVSISYEGSEIATLALAGAEEAVASMMECQATMATASADPFVPKADDI